MSCSKEEIERKRLAALQKRQNRNDTASPLKPLNPLNIPSTSVDKSKPYSPKSLHNAPRTLFHPYSKPQIGLSPKPETNRTIEPSFMNKVISGTVYLISEDRFEVNPSEFCTPLINTFKTIASKSYDPNTKLWSFSIKDYQELMQKVAPMAPDIVLGGLPNFVLKALNEPTIDPGTIDLSPIESTLRNKLMPFQEEGVRFGIAKRGRCMIADDMGLGKTYQALAVGSYYRRDWPMLIVTTSSMRDTWQSKVHELLPSTPITSVVSLSGRRDAAAVADGAAEVVVASYKVATSHADLLKAKRFGVVVIDESHSLKSHKARCTSALASICLSARRVVLLSGSPALSRPSELYTQLHLLQRDFFGGYTEYGKRYCAGKPGPFGWDMSGQSHGAELKVLLARKFLIRRTKDQVLTDLADKTREAVMLDPTLLDFSKEDQQGLSQLAEAYKTSSKDKHAALLTFFSESSKMKIPAVCKYIRQLLSEPSTDKFLVFAHHKDMVAAICETLDASGERYICITGNTPARNRADLVDRFQHNVTCRAAVLSITAANSGITLTAASLVLFAELHWNPGILCQAEARAHRIGRVGGVRARYLLAAGTADDHVWPMLRDKLRVLNEVGLSKDSFDGTTHTKQESKNNITQYLSPTSSKNKTDYIPGTNIKICKENKQNVNNRDNELVNSDNNFSDFDINDINFSDIDLSAVEDKNEEKSFLEDAEGDELLANLDL